MPLHRERHFYDRHLHAPIRKKRLSILLIRFSPNETIYQATIIGCSCYNTRTAVSDRRLTPDTIPSSTEENQQCQITVIRFRL